MLLILFSFRKTLLIQDHVGDLLAMVSTHAASVLKEKCEVLAAKWQALFQQNLHPVDTANDPYFEFLAFHFSMYNRYHEAVSDFRFFALISLN